MGNCVGGVDRGCSLFKVEWVKSIYVVNVVFFVESGIWYVGNGFGGIDIYYVVFVGGSNCVWEFVWDFDWFVNYG